MKRTLIVSLLCVLLFTALVYSQTAPRTYDLNAAPNTVHRNFFDAALKPVLIVNSGDSIRLQTATGNPAYFERLGVPKDKIPKELYDAFAGVEGTGRGDHTLNGPIQINTAEPGDVLEVRIKSVEVRFPIGAQSFTPNRGLLPEEFPFARDRVFFMDLAKQTVEYAPGVVVPLRPFWGVIGVAPPPGMGRVPSGPPNVFGGNLDNRDLGAGATLYLPVHVSGALLSIGDGHAVQGDGEVCISAIETSLKGEIQVIVHKGQPIQWPRAETATHWITKGLDPDLDQAAKIATREMLDWISEMKGMKKEDVYMLASSAMDLVVTQAVDGTKGIHALMPKAIFTAK